jgi:hypothetical protein
MGAQAGPSLGTRNSPLSTLAGPIFETKKFTLRANYTYQNASYFPLLGYYFGDRAGPYAEIKYRPVTQLELYAGASEYQNNVAKDPTLATFKTSSESAGASAQLPGKISVTAQFTMLDLESRTDAASPFLKSADQQKLITITRPFARHNLRVTVRDFQDVSPLGSQRQRSAEFDDDFHIKRLTLGAGIRIQRLIANPSRSSLYYRGSVQFHARRLSLYANYETGNDLQSRTLLSTSTVSTSVAGVSATFGKNWELQAEAYRNNLLTVLNPESIFVLQGQGVFVPGTLTALNQWSVYFRLTRRFHWGQLGAAGDLAGYAARQAPLRGSVEGYVRGSFAEGNYPAEGVTLSIDRGQTAVTDADGHYYFPGVPEGTRTVALAVHELPAEFEVGTNIESALLVLPSKSSHTDFSVVRLVTIQGKLSGPKDVPVDVVVIRMLPGDRYTTPDTDGAFAFYNVRAGAYTLTVDEKTLPEFGVLKGPGSVSVSVKGGGESALVAFAFEIHVPQKPVRKVLDQ